MPIVPVSWKHDWTYSGLKIGLLYGPWYVLNATFPPPPKHVRGQRLNKRKLEFAKLLRLPGRARKAERWQQHAMRRQYLSPGRSFRKSRASTQLILTQRSHLLLESHTYSQRRSWNSSRSPSNECHVLVNRGPLGMRAEHWYDFGTQAGGSDLFARIIAHIATATIPDVVLQYLRAGQVTPLAKPTGGHRPLLMMSFLRRLALKAVIAAKKPSVIAAAGPLQHGVGCQDGANKMIKSSQCFAEADQSRVLVALDLKAAFQNVSRRQMLHSLSQHDPDLATVFSRWYTSSTTHHMHYDGSYTHVQASSRIDQGCPL